MSSTDIPGPKIPGNPPGYFPEQPSPSAHRESVEASSLLRQIDQLLIQSERYVWLHAISTWLATSLLSLGILASCDALFRWQDPGMRWLCGTLWLISTLVCGFWWLRRAKRFGALTKPQRRERMCLQIERLFPNARYEVASAIAFAQQLESRGASATSTDAAGSSQLKLESIQRCHKLLQELPLQQCLDRRQPWRQFLLFALLATTALLTYFLAPNTFSLATQRLLAPWQALNWPRINQLQFVDLPQVAPAGEELSVRVIDANDQLPPKVQLEIQWPNQSNSPDRVRSETLEMKIASDTAQLSLPGSSLTPDGAQNKLRLRAKGGDDQTMPWQEIILADVPQLRSYTIAIEPPAYSGQANTEVTAASVRVLAGSRIQIRGEWSSAVQSATVDGWNVLPTSHVASSSDNIQAAPPPITSSDAVVVNLQNESTRFVLTASPQNSPLALSTTASPGVPIYQTTEFSIRWKSLDGIDVVGPKWTIQTIPDRIPTIELVKPLNEQPVTPNATIPLEAVVADDLGLEDISLHWKWVGSKGTDVAKDSQQEALWPLTDSTPANAERNTSLSQKIERQWTIPSNGSSEGITGLTLWVAAHDNAGQSAESRPITLRFTTPEQTLSELAQQQTDIRNRIEQAIQQQRDAALPVTSGLELLQNNSELQQQDRDALQSSARNQKNLRSALTQDRNSVKATLQSIAEQLNANNLTDSPLAQENQQLLDRLIQLDNTALSAAQQSVTRASQLANDAARRESSQDVTQELVNQLSDSNSNQNKIIADLQLMLDSLSRTESLRQSQSELMDVARKQRELHERTEQLQRSALLTPNSPGLTSERTRIEVAQSELARETERIQQQLRNDSEALQKSAPQLAENSAKLAEDLEAADLSSKMREARDAVQTGSFDDALAQQQTVMDAMASILEQTSQSTQPTLGQLEQALRGAQEALSNIANQQQTLSDSIADRNNPSEEKRASQITSQAKLRANTEQLTEQLEDWLGENSLEDLLQAAEDQQTAESALQAGKQSEAEQAAQDAANRLQRTSEMLEDMKLEIQQENIADQLQRLRPLVDRLYSEESQLATNSKDTWANIEPEVKDALSNRQDIPKDKQQAIEQTAREYAAQQLALRQLLARADADFKLLPAFELVTEAILADMDQAVAGFERSQFAETALPAVDAAQRRLKQLQDAIAESKPQPENPPENEEPEQENTEQAPSQTPSRAPLASLKLLRSLQQDLLQETQELAETSQKDELTATQQRRLSQLADLQQKLAEQVEALANEIGRERDNN